MIILNFTTLSFVCVIEQHYVLGVQWRKGVRREFHNRGFVLSI